MMFACRNKKVNEHKQYSLVIEETNNMTTIKKIIENADNAYYVAEYDKAIKLYKQVLDLDVNNKRAKEQLRKAERNRLSKNARPETVPTAALQLYKRSRSFIAAGDLAEARKLLKQAIDVAEKAGADFPDAQNLLGNIQNAIKAEEFKAKAHIEIDAGQWARAVDDLNSAFNLDPTDDAVGTLLSHLRSLLKAQNLINNLNAGTEEIGSRSGAIKEIRKIIKLTSETTELSKLWQEVVNLFGKYNNKTETLRIAILVVLCTSAVLLSVLWLFYLFPRNHVVTDCDLVSPDLQATLNYPTYVANGDKDSIEITFKNRGTTKINGSVVFDFGGTASVQLVDSADKVLTDFVDFGEKDMKKVTIKFLVDEPYKIISSPDHYVDFTVCPSNDDHNTFHIAMSPIYGLRNLIKFLWGTVGLTLVGLFWSQIKEWLLSVFKGKSK
jgi:tetratricopeptide (TPR) repeat protein